MYFHLKKIIFIPLAYSFFCLAGCQTNFSDADLEREELVTNRSSMGAGELLQTDANRVATIAMRNNLHGLYILLEKLYKRNPRNGAKLQTLSRMLENSCLTRLKMICLFQD